MTKEIVFEPELERVERATEYRYRENQEATLLAEIIEQMTDHADDIRDLRHYLHAAQDPHVRLKVIEKLISIDASSKGQPHFATDIIELFIGLADTGQILLEEYVFEGLEYLNRYLSRNKYLEFLTRLQSSGPLPEEILWQVQNDIAFIEENRAMLQK